MRTIPHLIDTAPNKNGIHVDTLTTLDERDRDVRFYIYRPASGESEEAPIILANGWTAGNKVMSRVALWLAHHGRTAVTFDHHRFSDKNEAPEQHKMQTLAAAAEGALEHLDEETIEVIAHSEGGINGTLYVDRERQRESGKVAKATLFAPAGIIDLSAPALVRRGAHEAVSLVHQSQLRHLGRLAGAGGAVGDYLRKNAMLSLSEIQAIADSHVVDNVIAIHEADIPIGVVGCVDDKFFPSRELRTSLPNQIPFQSIKSNHIDFINDREIRNHVYSFHQNLGQAALHLTVS